MSIFNRGNFTQLWVRLTSDEPLGVISTDYLEDYYGNDGFITLHHVDTVTDFQMAMVAVPEETPDTPNDVFQGAYSPLSELPDGAYELRFRCRDPYGNYTISNSVASPLGTERVLVLGLTLTTTSSGTVYVTSWHRGILAHGVMLMDLLRLTQVDLSRQQSFNFTLSRQGHVDLSRRYSFDIRR